MNVPCVPPGADHGHSDEQYQNDSSVGVRCKSSLNCDMCLSEHFHVPASEKEAPTDVDADDEAGVGGALEDGLSLTASASRSHARLCRLATRRRSVQTFSGRGRAAGRTRSLSRRRLQAREGVSQITLADRDRRDEKDDVMSQGSDRALAAMALSTESLPLSAAALATSTSSPLVAHTVSRPATSPSLSACTVNRPFAMGIESSAHVLPPASPSRSAAHMLPPASPSQKDASPRCTIVAPPSVAWAATTTNTAMSIEAGIFRRESLMSEISRLPTTVPQSPTTNRSHSMRWSVHGMYKLLPPQGTVSRPTVADGLSEHFSPSGAFPGVLVPRPASLPDDESRRSLPAQWEESVAGSTASESDASDLDTVQRPVILS
eukprot:TRINITY_DN6673_c0_g1_i1.p1 TRINITY_DN6673_c0_g1~~TRINITY_DN6673_c0_g1_i1.p1  ORF type:complete len:376 (-),score=37.59 TRINITY_DN6673_c0_g1_i1:710-1837(-)